MQDKAIREYLEYKGWTVAMAESEVMSAGKYRPRREEILKAARAGKIDAVVVWKLDRWGRSVADSIKSIQELTGLGVRFVAVTQNIDTDESNPMARFLLHIMAAFAELEREIIRERVVAGVKAAKANGKQVGATEACVPA